MRILIAPDSFKGTLSADRVCRIIGKAFEDRLPGCGIKTLPLADGGEGLCACMKKICGGREITACVSGVFGEKMQADYLMPGDGTAVIEMAACAGLPLAGEKRNPEKTTTYGVGELINDAVKHGARSVLLGLGGSATNDCGMGMAEALGFRFTDKEGNSLPPVGASLEKIEKIIPPANKFPLPVVCACDVENPLYGENGAAFVFAPQKGADEEMVKRLDRGLGNMAEKMKICLGADVASLRGAGAAGGLGAGAVVFLGAELKKGIDIILDRSGFDALLDESDLVITGEGRLDSQSLQGKVISGVAERAAAKGKRVITICGCKGSEWEKVKDIGVEKMYFSCPEPKPFDEVLRTCEEDLYAAACVAATEI